MKLGELLEPAYKKGGYIRTKSYFVAIRYDDVLQRFVEAAYEDGAYVCNIKYEHIPVHITGKMLDIVDWEYILNPILCNCCKENNKCRCR